MDENIDKLLKHKVSWLANCGPDDDIAISSRIRLARNLEGMPFPVAAKIEILNQARGAIELAVRNTACFKKDPVVFELEKLSELDKQVLLERRLVSEEFIEDGQGAGIAVSDDEIFGIMINEEDHMRIQAMKPGCQLSEVWDAVNAVDDKLSEELPFAFDSNLGYLTSCPTNVGTGMRASVMLHLPGLVLAEQVDAVIHGVSKLGLAVRGIFGEGSNNLGNLFQVSNQSTLGESEAQIIERLDAVIKQVISHEKNARHSMLEKKQNFLLDHVGRAYGVLRHAYRISSDETLNSLSALRLGVDMGMFSSVDIQTVNELFVIIQPAHLQKYAKRELDSEERDTYRASLVRDRLRSIDNNKH